VGNTDSTRCLLREAWCLFGVLRWKTQGRRTCLDLKTCQPGAEESVHGITLIVGRIGPVSKPTAGRGYDQSCGCDSETRLLRLRRGLEKRREWLIPSYVQSRDICTSVAKNYLHFLFPFSLSILFLCDSETRRGQGPDPGPSHSHTLHSHTRTNATTTPRMVEICRELPRHSPVSARLLRKASARNEQTLAISHDAYHNRRGQIIAAHGVFG
jgi:hypothetical protein